MTLVYILLGLIFVLGMVILFLHFVYIRPIKQLYNVLQRIDFDADTVNFTELDMLKLKGSKRVTFIKDKCDAFADVICERIERVNDEIDKGDRDGLTGFYNVKHLSTQQYVYTEQDNFTIIFIDVNNLKRMNDEYGHEAGDTLLCNAADKIAFWKDYGDVYRIGGDEFMIVLVNMTAVTIKELLNKWYPTVGCLNRETDGFKCVLSYGVASGQLGDGFERIRSLADSRMYNMKLKLKKKFGEPMR